MERRTAFMKQRSNDLRHGSNWIQFTSVQNMNEEHGRSSWFLLVSWCVSVLCAKRCLKIGRYVLIKVLLTLLTRCSTARKACVTKFKGKKHCCRELNAPFSHILCKAQQSLFLFCFPKESCQPFDSSERQKIGVVPMRTVDMQTMRTFLTSNSGYCTSFEHLNWIRVWLIRILLFG